MRTKRTYTIYIQRDPSISGYGGYDEWTLYDMLPEEADVLIARIDNAVNSTLKLFKLEGGFTGAN
jgi:hypothetical protein